MSAWITGIEGTEAAAGVALVLALMAALLHAVFGALQKGRHDPLLARGAIDAFYALIAMPFALFVVPWPEPPNIYGTITIGQVKDEFFINLKAKL